MEVPSLRCTIPKESKGKCGIPFNCSISNIRIARVVGLIATDRIASPRSSLVATWSSRGLKGIQSLSLSPERHKGI